jgi:two-component system heavy metal sensor histidine kinase CusS
VVCSLGVAGSVALSWLAIRRCLRPVTQLSNEAGAMTPRSLGRRLTAPPDGAEVAGLVRSFNQLLDRLEEAYAQLQAFNANVAHELRTPLASLVTGTQVTLSSIRSRDELLDALTSNLEEVELLNALVNDMLFLSRADMGDRAEGIESVDLEHEVDKALHYCEAMLHEHAIDAQRVGHASVLCNPALVRRAIVNLLTNAIRHTAPKGVVRVVIECGAETISLCVENPGPPIDAAVRTRMFDRFYRADAARSRHQPGHGLGLAIVAAIARMHGGTVFTTHSGGKNRVGLILQRLADWPVEGGTPLANRRDESISAGLTREDRER